MHPSHVRGRKIYIAALAAALLCAAAPTQAAGDGCSSKVQALTPITIAALGNPEALLASETAGRAKERGSLGLLRRVGRSPICLRGQANMTPAAIGDGLGCEVD